MDGQLVPPLSPKIKIFGDPIITLTGKKRAKVLLFFDMAKYFGKKMKKKCIFVILSLHFALLHGDG